ncbi:MAG: hypothetical protein KatS3mg008_0936 [Acidimicrobiales bacterium]|nr:MAG: hypothetical protein KatS3mg008_0936 [Acidimicrobiales bacterium]
MSGIEDDPFAPPPEGGATQGPPAGRAPRPSGGERQQVASDPASPGQANPDTTKIAIAVGLFALVGIFAVGIGIVRGSDDDGESANTFPPTTAGSAPTTAPQTTAAGSPPGSPQGTGGQVCPTGPWPGLYTVAPQDLKQPDASGVFVWWDLQYGWHIAVRDTSPEPRTYRATVTSNQTIPSYKVQPESATQNVDVRVGGNQILLTIPGGPELIDFSFNAGGCNATTVNFQLSSEPQPLGADEIRVGKSARAASPNFSVQRVSPQPSTTPPPPNPTTTRPGAA